ncbi:Serine-threonine/tyrosine-protein kinase, catalytic domain [Sesbania bispinosa]|nr:Serine-threonine/tyrosine-protein kinase, catalytic domain [Sesbania bispinosa]
MVLKCLGLCRSSQRQRQYPTVIEELCHHFSLSDIRKSTNNFDKNLIIGEGGCGKVYKGYLQLDVGADGTVAVKQMSGASLYASEGFKKEIELLCQLHHPNLISLKGFCNHKNEKIIVYEYMPNGSLHDHLHNKDMEPLSWKKRLEICIGVARGVHYLHTGARRTIIHRDIKPSNILLDSNMVAKISDFGFSLQGALSTSKPKPIQKPLAGTVGFLAPEVFLDTCVGWTDRCDVYSFGVVLLEVICAKTCVTITMEMRGLDGAMSKLPHEESENVRPAFHPYVISRLRAEEIIDPTLTGKIALECWEVFIDIIDGCLNEEPNERPTMGEVEVELERALTLQLEADARNTGGDHYSLSSTKRRKLQSKIN